MLTRLGERRRRQPDRDASRRAARAAARADRPGRDARRTPTCWSTPRRPGRRASSAQTIQFHGTADLYTLSGATAIATLYSDATTATANPAVTTAQRRRERRPGGLRSPTTSRARSSTRARATPRGRGRSATARSPIRTDDLFFGNAAGDPQPDWVDLNKVAIPQADEQQRLLANLILHAEPAPQAAAALLVPAEGPEGGGRDDRRQSRRRRHGAALRHLHRPEPGRLLGWPTGSACAPAATCTWAPRSPTRRRSAYHNQGFEVALHVNTDCADWTQASLRETSDTQLAAFAAAYPSVPPADHQPHPLHRVERLGDPARGRGRARHPARHQLLLLARELDPGPPRHVHRLGHADAVRRPRRHDDRLLPGRDPDDRRVGPDLPVHVGRAARPRDRPRGLLRRVQRQHALRFVARTPARTPSSPRRSARGVPVVSARQMLDLARRPQRVVVRSIAWTGTRLSFTIAVGAGAQQPARDGAGVDFGRPADGADPRRFAGRVHDRDHQGHRLRVLPGRRRQLRRHLRRRHHSAGHHRVVATPHVDGTRDDHLDHRRAVGLARGLRHRAGLADRQRVECRARHGAQRHAERPRCPAPRTTSASPPRMPDQQRDEPRAARGPTYVRHADPALRDGRYVRRIRRGNERGNLRGEGRRR